MIVTSSLYFIFHAASEEFLELVKSALLAALEGVWISTAYGLSERVEVKIILTMSFCFHPFDTILFCLPVLQPWDQARYLGLLPSAIRSGFTTFKDLSL